MKMSEYIKVGDLIGLLMSYSNDGEIGIEVFDAIPYWRCAH